MTATHAGFGDGRDIPLDRLALFTAFLGRLG